MRSFETEVEGAAGIAIEGDTRRRSAATAS
jgi:hypothetical protein